MPDASTLPLWVKTARAEAGLSLGQVALACGVSKAYLVDVEHDRKPCSLKIFVRLARLLDYEAWSCIEWFEQLMEPDVREYLLACAERRLSEGKSPYDGFEEGD